VQESLARKANIRRSPPVLKYPSFDEQQKRTTHVLQNRTILFALDTDAKYSLTSKNRLPILLPPKSIVLSKNNLFVNFVQQPDGGH
jgi:hypothetical protein